MYRDEIIKPYLAMTGELTLTGRVMPIGGLKEKILAARRNGIKEIIIPKRNVIDLEKLDAEVKGDVLFHPVEDISEVIAIAFPDETSRRLSKTILKTMDEKRRKEAEEEKEREKAKHSYDKAVRWE